MHRGLGILEMRSANQVIIYLQLVGKWWNINTR